MAKRFGVDLKISRLMLLIGLLCERRQRFRDGEQILRAMKAYRDDLPHPGTYLALCYMSEGRVREALAELDTVRAAYPEFQMSRVLLAIAHRDAGKSGWERLLEEVIEDGLDEYAVQLARDTLGLDSVAVAATTPDLETTSVHVPYGQRVYA